MLYPQIHEFVSSTTRNAWIRVNDNYELYLRHSQRAVGDHKVTCIDIANVSFLRPGPQWHGPIRVVRMLEALPVNLFIENVLNQRLAVWFSKREHYFRDPERVEPSFFRLTSEEEFRIRQT